MNVELTTVTRLLKGLVEELSRRSTFWSDHVSAPLSPRRFSISEKRFIPVGSIRVHGS